jgi:RNA polymerase sigma-70 factor, ECF subfamily
MNPPDRVQRNGWGQLGKRIDAGTQVTEGDTFRVRGGEVQRLIGRGEYRAALEALVQGYQHQIVRYCVAMLGDAAHGEEVAQEVFLGAYLALPRFRGEAAARTWLLAIARRQCLKARRDRGRRRRLEANRRSDIATGAHRAPEDAPEGEAEALGQRVRRGLDRLGAAQRTLLLLRYDTGLSLGEMAHVLGCSEASVRRQLARALEQLRQKLDAEP